MKKIYISLFIAITFISCKKNEDDSTKSTPVPTSTITYNKTVGGIGNGLTQFNRLGNDFPKDFAYFDHHIYVTDHINSRVVRLGLDLNATDWFAWKDTTYGLFTGDGTGDCCTLLGAVVKNDALYTMSGVFGAYINKINISDGSLINAISVQGISNIVGNFDVDSKENVYFQSDDYSKIIRFDKTGVKDMSFEIALKSNGLFAIDESDYIYVMDEVSEGSYEYELTKYSSDGSKIKSWLAGTTYYKLFDIYNNKIYCVSELQETNSLSANIYQYSLDGKLLRKFQLDQWQNSDMAMYNISGFKVVKEGVIFETEDQNRIASFSMTNQ